MNILVVGDKDHERQPVAEAVRQLGHSVVEAAVVGMARDLALA